MIFGHSSLKPKNTLFAIFATTIYLNDNDANTKIGYNSTLVVNFYNYQIIQNL